MNQQPQPNKQMKQSTQASAGNNWKNDPQQASEAGKKGGRKSGGNAGSRQGSQKGGRASH